MENTEMCTAVCRFCGQVQMVCAPIEVVHDEDALSRLAAEQCNCPGACDYQRRQESLRKAAEEFEALEVAPEVKDFLNQAALLCAQEMIDGVTVKPEGGLKIAVSLSCKDKLVVQFVHTNAIRQEF